MKTTRKSSIVLKALKYLSLSVLVIAVGLWCYLRFLVRDIAPIDDSSMKISRPRVPQMENGYPLLVQASISLNDPLYKAESDKLTQIRKELDRTGRFSVKTMKEARFYFKDRIATLERAGALKYSQGPVIDSLGDRIPNFLSVRNLMRIRLEMAREDFSRGRENAALQGIKAVLGVARVCAEDEGGPSFIGLMVSVAIKGDALKVLNLMLDQGYLPDGESLPAGFLSRQLARPDAWRNCMKAEYNMLNKVLKTAGKKGIYYAVFNRRPSFRDSLVERIFFGPVFHEQRARKKIYNFFSVTAADSGKSCSNARVRTGIEYPVIPATIPGTLSMIFKGEYGATLFAGVSIPNSRRGLERILFTDFEIQGMRLRLAALWFKRDTGKLPRALGDLAPKYIDEIPRDPFDGKLIRYNPEKGIIYSVGKNISDDHGAAKALVFSGKKDHEIMNEKDYVIKLEP